MMLIVLMIASLEYLLVVVDACTDDLSCNMNGKCVGGNCACLPQWKGVNCSTLNLLPAKPLASYNQPKTSTWGGNIIYEPKDGTYHMWIAEMAGGCGLTSWLHNSQIVHVSAASLDGPWVRKEVAIGIWSHNPIVLRSPIDNTLVMYHIGDGKPSNEFVCTPPDGTSPCGFIFSCNSSDPSDSASHLPLSRRSLSQNKLPISYATSVDGPWTTLEADISGPWGNNPAPYFFKNGSVLITFNNDGMVMAYADKWTGPYKYYGNNACGGGEDPFIYFDPQEEVIHCLFHRAPFSDIDVAIGHAFSTTKGQTWHVTPEPAANTTITWEDGTVVRFGKRERPHLYLVDGYPKYFVSGICVNGDYFKCDRNFYPGHFDKTFTLVQEIAS